MELSPHFERSEFEIEGPMPENCVGAYTALCLNILEPIRAHVNEPLIITSGYRSPAGNAAAHGVSNSQHVATANWCAADFRVDGMDSLNSLFDWIRLKSGIESIDQLILEHNMQTDRDIIHVSWVSSGPRHDALEGETANQSPYKVLAFNDAQQAEDQNWPLV